MDAPEPDEARGGPGAVVLALRVAGLALYVLFATLLVTAEPDLRPPVATWAPTIGSGLAALALTVTARLLARRP